MSEKRTACVRCGGKGILDKVLFYFELGNPVRTERYILCLPCGKQMDIKCSKRSPKYFCRKIESGDSGDE
jgi:hypothetical protein